MDYEKAYKEALKRAKAAMDIAADKDLVEGVVRTIFPELRESEDERIREEIIEFLQNTIIKRGIKDGNDKAVKWIAYLEKQKEIPMPNSSELIEMWDEEKAMLEEKDFRDDAWRLAQNAFMDGFARGTCVKSKKQKEQKPAGYLDKDKVYAIMKKLHDLAFSQRILINSDEYKKINEITSDVRSLLDSPIEQKHVEIHIDNPNIQKVDPDIKISTSDSSASGGAVNVESDYDKGWRDGHRAGLKDVENDKCKIIEKHITKNVISDEVEKRLKECGWYVTAKENIRWNEKDEKIRKNLIEFLIRLSANTRTDSTSPNYSYPREIAWLKSLPERFNLQPKQEWSEEDIKKIRSEEYTKGFNDAAFVSKLKEWSVEDEDRIRQIERIAQEAGCTQKLQEEIHNWLKSLRPSWKPSEEQMKALEGAQLLCEHGLERKDISAALKSLCEQLRKLGVKEDPEYYQHFDPDC